MKRLQKLRDLGLIGCLNDSGITSVNYKNLSSSSSETDLVAGSGKETDWVVSSGKPITCQLSKKARSKKKPNRKEEGHWEGKYWCNCKTRNYRRWLGRKFGIHKKAEIQNFDGPTTVCEGILGTIIRL